MFKTQNLRNACLFFYKMSTITKWGCFFSGRSIAIAKLTKENTKISTPPFGTLLTCVKRVQLYKKSGLDKYFDLLCYKTLKHEKNKLYKCTWVFLNKMSQNFCRYNRQPILSKVWKEIVQCGNNGAIFQKSMIIFRFSNFRPKVMCYNKIQIILTSAVYIITTKHKATWMNDAARNKIHGAVHKWRHPFSEIFDRSLSLVTHFTK